MALVDARPALREAAALGGFFALPQLGDPGGWHPLRELVDGDEAVRERVGAATDLLAARAGSPPFALEPRVVASTVFLGLAARLVAPPVASVLLAGVLPRLTIDRLWWQPVETGPWPLAVEGTAGDEVAETDAPAALGSLVARLATPVVARFRETFRLSDRVLWGNVASALGGTTPMLAARPDVAAPATRLVAGLLRTAPLAGTADLLGGGPSLVRRSCCLFYRVPGGGLCGDCVLAARRA